MKEVRWLNVAFKKFIKYDEKILNFFYHFDVIFIFRTPNLLIFISKSNPRVGFFNNLMLLLGYTFNIPWRRTEREFKVIIPPLYLRKIFHSRSVATCHIFHSIILLRFSLQDIKAFTSLFIISSYICHTNNHWVLGEDFPQMIRPRHCCILFAEDQMVEKESLHGFLTGRCRVHRVARYL